MFTLLSIYSFISPSFHPSIRPSVHPSIRPSAGGGSTLPRTEWWLCCCPCSPPLAATMTNVRPYLEAVNLLWEAFHIHSEENNHRSHPLFMRVSSLCPQQPGTVMHLWRCTPLGLTHRAGASSHLVSTPTLMWLNDGCIASWVTATFLQAKPNSKEQFTPNVQRKALKYDTKKWKMPFGWF